MYMGVRQFGTDYVENISQTTYRPGFIHIFQNRIQGFLKDFQHKVQGHTVFQGPKNAKPSFENPKFIVVLHHDRC